jgi:hypothetical protein
MAENEQNLTPAAAEGEGQAAGGDEATAQPAETAETAETVETAQPDASAETAASPEAQDEAPAAPPEEITYHAVEKDGNVTALWEMQGNKHLRTIDPRSRQGQEILRLYTAEHPE